jgi:hypothetical protein
MSLILDGSNGLSDVDGSAATPAIRGTDTNTGIFFPAADTIAFSEGGTEAMRIDGSGNVGIGTTSPYAVGGSWKMLNVGIGGIQGGIAATNSTLLVQNCYYNGSSWQRASTGATGYIDVGGGNIAFSNDASGSAGTFTPTERMRINSAGQVTIPNQPSFSAFGLGGTFSSSSWAKVSYTTALTNVGSHYNAGNARFTAPVGGSYYFYFNALHRSTTNGARMALYKNGTKFYDAGNSSFSQTYNQVNAEVMAGAGVVITLAVNDYVEVYGIVAGAGDIYTASNGHNIFMGYLIG